MSRVALACGEMSMPQTLDHRGNSRESNLSCHDTQDFRSLIGERKEDVAKGTDKMVIFALLIARLWFVSDGNMSPHRAVTAKYELKI